MSEWAIVSQPLHILCCCCHNSIPWSNGSILGLIEFVESNVCVFSILFKPNPFTIVTNNLQNLYIYINYTQRTPSTNTRFSACIFTIFIGFFRNCNSHMLIENEKEKYKFFYKFDLNTPKNQKHTIRVRKTNPTLLNWYIQFSQLANFKMREKLGVVLCVCVFVFAAKQRIGFCVQHWCENCINSLPKELHFIFL